MLVLCIAAKMAGWRLENVRRWDAPGGNAPPIVLQEQGGLGLSSGKAELTHVTGQTPGRVILPQRLQTPGNVGFIKPFDFIFRSISYGVQTIGRHELNSTSAIFTDMGDQGKNIARRNLEFRGRRVRNDARGRLIFIYSDDWRKAPGTYPLSLSMPLAAKEHGRSVIEACLWGLLPDNEQILARCTSFAPSRAMSSPVMISSLSG